MLCSKCGAALSANDIFCSKCGEAVTSGSEQAVPYIAAVPTPSPTVATSTSFRDPTKLTTWLKFFLYASIIIHAVALFSGVLQYQLLSEFKLGVYSSEALATSSAESNDKREQIIGMLQFGIGIITIILFAMWIHRANSNSRALGAQNMKFTPGWSVGYYFIPILWFWKPYQAMKEIWRASKSPASWESVTRGTVLPWWWLFFLISVMLGHVSFRSALQAKEINELLTTTGIMIASDLVSIPAAIIAIVLVKQIYEMQMSHVQDRIQHCAPGGRCAAKPRTSPDLYVMQQSFPAHLLTLTSNLKLLSLILAAGILTFVVWHIGARYAQFHTSLTEIRGIKLSDSREEVLYRLGMPTYVIDTENIYVFEEREFRRVFIIDANSDDVNRMPDGKRVEDFLEWEYKTSNDPSRLTVVFGKDGRVEALGVYCPEGRHVCWKPIAGIESAADEEDVLRLGEPKIVKVSSATKTVRFEDIGVTVYLAKGRAYKVVISGPKQAGANHFLRFTRSLF